MQQSNHAAIKHVAIRISLATTSCYVP